MVELSIVIPTRDRPSSLRACLAALANQQNVTGEIEVVVVDDGSVRNVEPSLAGWPGGPVRLLHQANAGPGAARNRGAREARGRVLLFLDDDVVGETELVATHLAAHRDADRIVGLGHMTLRPSRAAGPSGRNLREWWKSHYQKLVEQPDRPGFRLPAPGDRPPGVPEGIPGVRGRRGGFGPGGCRAVPATSSDAAGDAARRLCPGRPQGAGRAPVDVFSARDPCPHSAH